MDKSEPGQGDSESIDSRLQRLADYETIEVDPEWRSAISLMREVVNLVEHNSDIRARLACEERRLEEFLEELLSGKASSAEILRQMYEADDVQAGL